MNSEHYSRFVSALADSEAGESLKSQSRWQSHFHTNESAETWKQVFGATGQVFTHSTLFYHLARWFVRNENEYFSPRSSKTFLYGIAPHDIGEAKINGRGVGDVSAQTKTARDERMESKMASHALESLKLPKAIKKRLLSGYDKVVNGKNEKLHFAFKALEKTEYVLTAMKVYQNCRRLNSEGRPALNPFMEKALVGRVLVFDLAKLLDVYAPQFPNSIGKLLKNSEDLIEEMFNFSLPWLLATKEWSGKPFDHETKVLEFEEKWNNFKNQNQT